MPPSWSLSVLTRVGYLSGVITWLLFMSVLNEINDTSVIARQKIERNMLSFRNALSLMILTRTRDSNVMCNALELAQSKIRVLALIK